MTATFDAATESERDNANVNDPYEFTHTPVGTPAAVVVYIIQDGEGTDQITGVTYGGQAMTRTAAAFSTVSTEDGAAYAYTLLASIPTGAQTVSTDHTFGNVNCLFVCMTYTASAAVEVVDFDSTNTAAADPQLSLTYVGAELAVASCGLFSGHSLLASVSPISGMTAVHNFDPGDSTCYVDRQTTASTTGFTIGYTATTEDVAMVAVALGDGTTAASKVHSLGLTGVG